MALKTKITVDGTDVTSYTLKYTVVDTIKDTTPATITFITNILDVIALEKDQEVIITRGETTSTDTTIFKGNISQITKNRRLNIEVECLDKLWLLSRQQLTLSYDKNIDEENGKISAIASDLITRGGLTPDVEDSGTDFLIDKYILRSDNILEKLQELAELIDYTVYFDPLADTVNFKTRGFETFGTTLQTGVNLVSVPVWGYDYSKIINDLTITGDLQEIETTEEELFSSETEMSLLRTPESVKIFVDGTLKTGGITGQSTSFDYSVDKLNKKINFESSTSGTVEARYSYKEPIKVRRKDPASIGNFGTHAVHKKIPTIQTTNDAEIKSNEILEKFSSPLVTVDGVKISNVFGMRAGQKVEINDTVNNENRVVNIRRYTYNYPLNMDDLEVDDEPIYEDYILKNAFRKRIERLERANESSGDIITQILSFFRTFSPRRRFNKLVKESTSGTTGFILNDNNFGVLDTNALGSPFTALGQWTVKLVQGNMTYYEDFRDTEFEDSNNSDTTIDTTNKRLVFSTGSVWTSGTIHKSGTISSVRLDTGSTSGTFTYEVTSNAKSNWQTFSTGAIVGITNPGQEVYFRITEAGTSSGTITNTTNSVGEITSPAINLQLIEG